MVSTRCTTRLQRYPSSLGAWLATSAIAGILALTPSTHAQDTADDPAVDHLVAYAGIYKRLRPLKDLADEVESAYALITWTQRTVSEAAADRPPPSSAFDNLDLDPHIDRVRRHVNALAPLEFEAPLRMGPSPQDRHARREVHRERAQSLGAAAAEVLVARGGVAQIRAYRAQLDGADAMLDALAQGLLLMLERGAYAIPVLRATLPGMWFDIEAGYRRRLSDIRIDLGMRARGWEQQGQVRANEIGLAIDTQLDALEAEERALTADRERILRSRSELEAWAERIRAIETTLQQIRAKLAAANDVVRRAESALARNRRDREAASRDLDTASQRARVAQANLSVPFHETQWRCPNGQVWDYCGHHDLKQSYSNWQASNRATVEGARQQFRSAQEAIARLDRERPTLVRGLDDAKDSVQSLQKRERDEAFELDAQRAGYAVNFRAAWRWAVESRAEAYYREVVSERGQLYGLRGRLK